MTQEHQPTQAERDLEEILTTVETFLSSFHEGNLEKMQVDLKSLGEIAERNGHPRILDLLVEIDLSGSLLPKLMKLVKQFF